MKFASNMKKYVIKPMYDDDKYATEVTCGGTRILPPENYLIGTVEQTERGFVVEFIDKSKQ